MTRSGLDYLLGVTMMVMLSSCGCAEHGQVTTSANDESLLSDSERTTYRKQFSQLGIPFPESAKTHAELYTKEVEQALRKVYGDLGVSFPEKATTMEEATMPLFEVLGRAASEPSLGTPSSPPPPPSK